jgi:hypothetical protein
MPARGADVSVFIGMPLLPQSFGGVWRRAYRLVYLLQ